MRKWLSAGVLVLIAGIEFAFLKSSFPILFVSNSNEWSLVQTIIDHRLPTTRTSYEFSGTPQLVVTKPWELGDQTIREKLFWCKVIDKEGEAKKSFWKKVCDKCVSLFRFMAFDEKGALIVTDHPYSVDDEIRPGRYIYLGILRATIHIEGYGTGVWEFPWYMDNRMPFDSLNSILKLTEGDIVSIIRNVVYATVTPEQSYKVQQVERGAMRMESWQPWIDMSGDVTIEYIGSGIHSGCQNPQTQKL